MLSHGVRFLTDETAAGSAEWVALSAALIGLALLVLAGLDSTNREISAEVTERLNEAYPEIDL